MALTRLGPNNSTNISGINLTSQVTGTLPVANGGTAITSGFVNGVTQGFSSVYMPGDLAISGDSYISASGTGVNGTCSQPSPDSGGGKPVGDDAFLTIT